MAYGSFNNPIINAIGALIVNQIQSQNFSTLNQTGWQVKADGGATFYSLTVQGGTIVVEGSSGAILIYSGVPALGNLIGSWAGLSGTDSVGNSYPQGLNVTKGSISGTTFSGTDFVINTSGAFFYSGTPALGNLICSIAPSAGSDSFGNAYIQGFADYVSGGGDVVTFAMGIVNGFAGFSASSKNFAPSANPVMNMVPNTGGCHLDLSSGKALVGGVSAILNLEDSTYSGVTGGFSWLQVGQAQFGNSAILLWDSNNAALYFPNSSTPPTPGTGNVLHASSTTGAMFLVNPAGTNRPISQSSSGGGGQTVTQAAYNPISDGYTINAAEVVAGTTFRLTAWGSGTWGSTAQNLFMALDTAGTSAAEIPSSAQTAGGNAIWRCEIILRFTGASTANAHTLLTASGFPGAAAWAANGDATGVTIAFPYTFNIDAKWNSTTGSPTVTCHGSIIERLAN